MGNARKVNNHMHSTVLGNKIGITLVTYWLTSAVSSSPIVTYRLMLINYTNIQTNLKNSLQTERKALCTRMLPPSSKSSTASQSWSFCLKSLSVRAACLLTHNPPCSHTYISEFLVFGLDSIFCKRNRPLL